MTLRDPLDESLRGQIRRVAVHGHNEVRRIQNAVEAIPDLTSSLGLDGFVAMLTADDKPRVVLRFRRSGLPSLRRLDTDVVLKVYGDRPRGEGPLLKEWRARGLPVPSLETGETVFCSWLLMEYLPRAPMLIQPDGVSELTDLLASLGPLMHAPTPQLLPVLRRLDAVMIPRWLHATVTLRQHGWQVPEAWHAAVEARYCSLEPVPLHGDLGPSNIAADAHGSPVLFDASALLGPRAFDAARWSARLAAWSRPPLEVFSRWLEFESCEGPDAYELLALECVLEAGSLEIVRSRKRSVRALHGLSHDSLHVDNTIKELLCVASEILS